MDRISKNTFFKSFVYISTLVVVAGSLFILNTSEAVAKGMSERNPFAIGMVFGTPTGLSGRYWLSRRDSLVSAVGWTDHHLNTHLDYIRQRSDIFQIDKESFDGYFGGGIRLHQVEKLGEVEERLGVRAPLGLRFRIDDPSIELFIELAFVMDLLPETSGGVDFSLGFRYILF